MTVHETAVMDGVAMPLAEAALPFSDQGVVRGDGGFETMGVWSGRIFRRDDHLARLRNSLAIALLPPVDDALLEDDIDVALERGIGGRDVDAALRVYVTASQTRVVLLTEQPQRQANRWLHPVAAPWIRPVGSYALAGAKTMSYMPNMTATRVANRTGADDALLVSLEGMVLEGPTFAIAWITDNELYAPSTDLGVIDSVSRRAVLEIAAEEGLTVHTGAWDLSTLKAAGEVMTSSAVRPLRALQRIDDHDYGPSTPVTDALAAALEERRRDGG